MQRALTETQEENIVCLCCGRTMSTTSSRAKRVARAIKSTSNLFKTYEYIPWCFDCQVEILKGQMNMYHDIQTAMLYFCKIIDYPYLPNLIKDENADIEAILDVYYKGAQVAYAPKIKQGFLGGSCLSEREMPLRVDAEVVGNEVEIYNLGKSTARGEYEKWGRNKRYSPDDYADLEDIYKSIALQNGIILDEDGQIADKVTEIAVIEAACNLLQSRKCRNNGDAEDAKRYYDLYDKAMGSQLLRAKDAKDKQVGDILIQDIVKYCESDDFIEPWDRMVKYPHKKDIVDQILLHIMNYVGRLTADVFNIHVSKLEKLPKDYKLNYKNDEFPTEETEFDKMYDNALKDIADFKTRQHISDDDSDEDSADLDEDNDSDATLLGTEEE